MIKCFKTELIMIQIFLFMNLFLYIIFLLSKFIHRLITYVMHYCWENYVISAKIKQDDTAKKFLNFQNIYEKEMNKLFLFFSKKRLLYSKPNYLKYAKDIQ